METEPGEAISRNDDHLRRPLGVRLGNAAPLAMSRRETLNSHRRELRVRRAEETRTVGTQSFR